MLAAFTQEPLLDEEPDPNTKLEGRGFRSRRCVQGSMYMEKSTGPNELHPEILRKITQYITAPWTTIFNMSVG